MDLWQEITPGSDVWCISREMYLSVCVCVANRSGRRVGITFEWHGDPAECNAVVLAPPGFEDGLFIERVISPQRTVMIAAVSPANEELPMAVDYSLRVTNISGEGHRQVLTLPAPMVDGSLDVFDKSVEQTREVEDWLRQRASHIR